MDTDKKIILLSSEGDAFEVDTAVAMASQTIKHMIEDRCTEGGIPLPNVTSRILAKVLEYCKMHVNDYSVLSDDVTKLVPEELTAWDAEFVSVDQETLFSIILAANYLHIQRLLDLACQSVANMIRGQTTEEIRKIFNIKNDFDPEEEEEIRKENEWAFM
ncbi:SKP1-like protein 1B [Zingiber officinale]|uniref:SKP1-like protein n=1 Tax=Zingiber officinale TaxID=94328 RepID=A0A8J5HGE5_ZINOF|nr:SKP1-like protein 1B [Zingiber officinale]KAG6526435.1 hypothetical protein ZIOFF_016420 [Zingiber officinale]